MGLIYRHEIEDLVHAIEGDAPAINMARVINMQEAVLALRGGIPMGTIVREVGETLEQHLIQHVLMLTQGNKSEAARRLRIDYKTLYRKLQKYALSQGPERHQGSDLGGV